MKESLRLLMVVEIVKIVDFAVHVKFFFITFTSAKS